MITLITLCKNEEVLMPFFIRHYEPIVDKIYLFDNCSTDSSVSLASKCPKIEIVKYDTGGVLRDDIHMKIKNGFYREKKLFDWVIIVDFDEFLYHKDFRKLLQEYDSHNINFPKITGYNMIGTEVPKDDEITPITKIINMGVPTDSFGWNIGPNFVGSYSKRAIFNAKNMSVSYEPGCHKCNPSGTIIESENADIKLLHYKWLSREWGFRFYKYNNLSKENIINGYGIIDINARMAYFDNSLARRVVIPELES